MKTITIGFSHGHTILSRIIQLATRSKLSHTYIQVKTHFANPEYLIYQASGLTVNAESKENFMGHATIVAEIPVRISDAKYKEILEFILTRLGKPYSFKQLLGMAWILFLRNFGVKAKNPFRDGDHSFICVELIARILDLPEAEELSPQDLLDLLTR